MKTGRWVKLGQLYCPTGLDRHPKLVSHAANPVPVHLIGDTYRIFFSGRDVQNRSSVGAVDVDVIRKKIILEHRAPFFEFGPDGSFYSHGVSIGNCYDVGGVTYLPFMGWQNPEGSHWRGDIGRLIVNPDLTLRLDSETPLMSSDATDPLSLSYPWVCRSENGGFDMWYGSTVNWDAGNGEMLHVIKYANSPDGHVWYRQGQAVPHEIGVAQAFSRPVVIGDPGGISEMWFSYRPGNSKSYRIGHATSADRRVFVLDLANAAIDVSSEGWDSEMTEYPFVLDHGGQRYMFYNGNGFGRTGFGLAVLTHA